MFMLFPLLHSLDRALLDNIEVAMNIAFTVELLLRMVALGGLLRYISSPWNCFDSLLVVIGYLTLIQVSAVLVSGVAPISLLYGEVALMPSPAALGLPPAKQLHGVVFM